MMDLSELYLLRTVRMTKEKKLDVFISFGSCRSFPFGAVDVDVVVDVDDLE